MLRWLWVVFFLGTLVTGCKNAPPVKTDRVAPAADPWLLICSDSTAQTPALLWNGLIGLRIARNGSGLNQPMFDIDEYQTGGEEKILVLPSISTADVPFNPRSVDRYQQRLDMRTGILTTSWREGSNEVSVQTVLDPERRIFSEKWTGVNPSFQKLKPWPDGTEILESIVGREKTVSIGTPVNRKAMLSALGASPGESSRAEPCPKFEEVAKRAADYWMRAWKTDIEIDGPVEDQQAVRSFMFYLRSGIAPRQVMTVCPFGLSSERYSGHAFWDADVWVFPALALLDPTKARSIPEYRLARLPAAERGYRDWVKAGKPTATGKVLGNQFVVDALKYPWESSVSGAETVLGPSRFEDHITGSVMWSLDRAEALDLAPEPAVERAGTQSRLFWMSRAEMSGGKWGIRGVVSPDENHMGDSDLYTNLLARFCIGRHVQNSGLGPDAITAKNVYLPHDDKSLLTYDRDQLRGYKQAAAVLAIFPLQEPEAEAQAKVMMDRFENKVIKNGPAMTDSVHAVIWARLSETDKAYQTWRQGWQDFTKAPLMLFSEKRSREATYFTTGAAGCLETVLYGFLGFRIDSKKDPKAAWTKQLKAGQWLSVTPHLPSAWRSVKLKNFAVLGTRYTLMVTPRGVQVTPGD